MNCHLCWQENAIKKPHSIEYNLNLKYFTLWTDKHEMTTDVINKSDTILSPTITTENPNETGLKKTKAEK